MSLGYASGGFRFPFRTVKGLTFWDNVRWALRGPGLSSGLACDPPQNAKVTWPRAKFPFFVKIVPTGSHDGHGNWDHLNLNFPVYLKLMTGFPSVYPEDVGVELLH